MECETQFLNLNKYGRLTASIFCRDFWIW